MSALLSDIKMQEYLWLNLNHLVQMATIDSECWVRCMSLGLNQTDPVFYDGEPAAAAAAAAAATAATAGGSGGSRSNQTSAPPGGGRGRTTTCKLRPDEGLDAISSLAPGSVTSKYLMGGTNTVYAWLTQWLADNLGYDVTSLIGLPYDWRLSPDVTERRDGFLTLTKRRIEAAVKTNGGVPGIMVAHSMGNVVFRYFLEWLRLELRQEVLDELVETRDRKREGGGGTPSHKGWLGGLLDGAQDGTRGGTGDGAGDGDGNGHGDGDERELAHILELSRIKGNQLWLKWIDDHIWTYVGLSAPLLGAVNPVRAVISGENMGLPMTDAVARRLELSFGSTNNAVPISTKMGFCDAIGGADRSKLACLEELIPEIEEAGKRRTEFGKAQDSDPWKAFPALRHLLKDRVDWETNFPMIQARIERCEAAEKRPCRNMTEVNFSALDAPNGDIFEQFDRMWNEKDSPLLIKRDQLLGTFWHGPVANLLNTTWDRPHIKHVVMGYGVDVPTEVGYVYSKRERAPADGNDDKVCLDDNECGADEYDGIPEVESIVWEESNGQLFSDLLQSKEQRKTFTEKIVSLGKRKLTRTPINGTTLLGHSGDGTIPYLSLSWAHTWLLHATRAMRHSSDAPSRITDRTSLDEIKISHRPKGGSEWIKGPKPDDEDEEAFTEGKNDGDTGTRNPHGTKYKPTMVRWESAGTSRKTGMSYTTTVIEAIGVEHKETTRNYDILAAVFTDALKNLHDDFPDIV